MSDGRDDDPESAREGDDDPPEGASREGSDGPHEVAREGNDRPPGAGPGTGGSPNDPVAGEPGEDRRRGPAGSDSDHPPGAGSGRSVGHSDGQSPPTDARDQGGGAGAGGAARATTGPGRRGTDPAEYTTGKRSLSPRVQLHWGIRTIIGAVILGVIVSFVLRGFNRDPRLGGALTAALVILGTVWVVLQYRIWVYQIRDDAIYLERGVVTHVRTLVPYVRIQHVDTSRSPFERALGLSTLVVYTAGSRGADVSIPGLTPREASDLQQRVKELAIEAEGDDAL